MTTTDTADGNQASISASINVADTSMPSETINSSYSGNENTAISLTGLSVSASPNTTDPLSSTLSVTHGTLTVGSQSGSSVTIAGTAAQINTALTSASYTGSLNFYGTDTLSMTTTDTADGNHTSASASISVADAATITETGVTTGNFSGYENTAIPLTGISVSDSNTNDGTLKSTLSVTHGTISIGSTSGSATVSGNGSGTVTLTGTAAQIDTSLGNVSYTGNFNFTGSDTLSVTSTDGGGRSSRTNTGTIVVSVPSDYNSNDSVTTGANNTITLGNGNDSVTAGANSTITLGKGNDSVTAGANSTITLGKGNDTIYAGANDTITLGNGNDTVYAGAGDTITLGSGHDLVLFGVNPSPSIMDSEIVNRFNPNNDIIEFNRALFANFTAVLADAKQADVGTIITHDPNNTVTLLGVTLAALTANNIKTV